MVLLDEVRAWTVDDVACEATIGAAHPYARNGRVPAVLALELMAQATAAYLGLLGRELGQPMQGGLLAGASELDLSIDAFELGDVLEVRSTRVWGHGIHWRFDCEVWRDGARVAAGTLNVIRGHAHDDA
jgi:predicted hotdog family 3-hydroxylacyl-ACP dehydratase